MKKACRLRQHGSCNVRAWRFGGAANASITRATIWFRGRSSKNGFSREEVREQVCELLLEIARHHGFEIEELEVDTDHGHLFLSFPPECSIGQVAGQRGECARDSRGITGRAQATLGWRVWGGRIKCAYGGGSGDGRGEQEVYSVS
jgi:REP element-mobilizing transposase RayT